MDATLTMMGSVLEPDAAAIRRGAKVATTSKSPNTLVSNIFLTCWGSDSIAGASYTIHSSAKFVRKKVSRFYNRPRSNYAAKINEATGTKQNSLVPALLNKMSSLPPVLLAISCFKRAMLSGEVTSRAKVSMPFSERLFSDFSDRAVANTRRPLAANSRARALPEPPSEHLSRGGKISKP